METLEISPAPWSAKPPHDSDGFAYIVDADGNQIALVIAVGRPVPSGNAPLLAAAPKLADALEAILASDGSRGTFDASALYAAQGKAAEALCIAGRITEEASSVDPEDGPECGEFLEEDEGSICYQCRGELENAPALADALELALSVLSERHGFSRVNEALRIGNLALSKARMISGAP